MTDNENNELHFVDIRLSPQLGCWPTWRRSQDENFDPATIIKDPILLAKLNAWDDRFQASYDSKDYAAMPSQAFLDKHDLEGEELATEIAAHINGPVVKYIK